MYTNQDDEELEIEALNLIDRADELLNQGKGKQAIELYEKAAQKYLEMGSYLKLDQLFIKITSIISRFKNNIQAVYRLKSIIRKTEELGLHDISGQLLMRLGNISYEMRDFTSAGEAYERAAEHFLKISSEGEDEFEDIAAKMLLKAGEAYERTKSNKDLGERLILKGVMLANKVDELYQSEEKRALKLLNLEDYNAAAQKYLKIANYFQEAYATIDTHTDKSDRTEIINNAKSRLLHLQAEYVLVAALCLRASEKREYNPQIKTLGQESFELLKKSVAILKDVFKSDGIETDKEDILRITFDTMLISVVNEMLGEKKINSIEYLLSEIKNKKLVKSIKESVFFKLTERIEKVGIRESLRDIRKANLGHFNKIKEILIGYFMDTK
ncbi:MAG: Tetratricopeptide domain protein [Promethearchaeota archaeon]|nr:MAG: Tetratricopeptide domain protein [Candidatus Lokiarchaeota archaeon]